MKRFITYFFTYDNGKKGRNIGFVRVDQRADTYHMEVHLQGLGQYRGTGAVFLLHGENRLSGEKVGNIDISQGRGIWVFDGTEEYLCENAPLAKRPAGVAIRFGERLYAASSWRERVSKELIWGTYAVEEDIPQEDGEQERAPENEEKQAQEGVPESAEKRAQERQQEGTVKQVQGSLREGTEEQVQGRTPETVEKQAQGHPRKETEKHAQERAPENEEKQAQEGVPESAEKRAQERQQEGTVKQVQGSLREGTEEQVQGRTPENEEKHAQERLQENTEERAKAGVPESAEKHAQERLQENTEERAKAGIPESAEKRAQERLQESAPEQAQERPQESTEILAQEGMPKNAEAYAQEKAAKSTQACRKERTAERRIVQPGLGEELPHVPAGARIRRIDLSDIKKLPKRNWYLCNNSFLIHGFFNYHYLILEEVEEEGRTKCYLGVPGIYERPERMMAMMFGFSGFELERESEQTPENFGYWLCLLDM